MVWNGMERKFRYGIWKMPEWNGMEDILIVLRASGLKATSSEA